MAKIKLDLNDIVRKKQVIEQELSRAVEEAVAKRICLIDIVSDEKSGELRKCVLRFLAQPKIKELYHRVEKDDKNYGRILVHFKLRSRRKTIGLYGFTPLEEEVL